MGWIPLRTIAHAWRKYTFLRKKNSDLWLLSKSVTNVFNRSNNQDYSTHKPISKLPSNKSTIRYILLYSCMSWLKIEFFLHIKTIKTVKKRGIFFLFTLKSIPIFTLQTLQFPGEMSALPEFIQNLQLLSGQKRVYFVHSSISMDVYFTSFIHAFIKSCMHVLWIAKKHLGTFFI